MSTNSVETAVGTDTATVFEPGAKPSADSKAITRDNAADVLEIGEKPPVVKKPEEDAAPVLGEDGKPLPEKTAETTEETPAVLEPLEALPEYDAAKPEVQALYEGRFLDADKKLSREAISRDFWEARAKDPQAYLAPGTMAWATSHFNVDEAFVKDVCDGLLHNNAAREAAQFSSLAPEGTPEADRVEAGKQTLSAAAKWARDGGYTKDQAAAFNKLAAKGGPEYQDAMELLIVRHKAVVAKAPPVPAPEQRRPASPQRVVSGGGGETVAVTPYASRAEYRKDREAAGSDPAKVTLTRQRAAISDFN